MLFLKNSYAVPTLVGTALVGQLPISTSKNQCKCSAKGQTVGLSQGHQAHYSLCHSQIKFVSGSLDGKWQTRSVRSGRWTEHEIPVLECVVGDVEFIQNFPIFFVLWDDIANKCKAQGALSLKGLGETGAALKFEVPMTHEGASAGVLAGVVSIVELDDDDDMMLQVCAFTFCLFFRR